MEWDTKAFWDGWTAGALSIGILVGIARLFGLG
jgi:hypothetical protein